MIQYRFFQPVCLSLLIYFAFVTFYRGLGTHSADLFALWLAAGFMAAEMTDQIYPVHDVLFTMTPPEIWWAKAVEIVPDGKVFPYIYPPIWAKLAAPLTLWMDFAMFDRIVAVLHQGLLIATIALAGRICRIPPARLMVYVLLTYAALVFTVPIQIAIRENQPQILVSFLIIFAFERIQFGHSKTGGAVLALAAGIKLYPLLFMVILLARRQWTAAGAFIVLGGLLGSLSILLAGWPLHVEYLHLIGVLSNSVIVSNFSFSIDSVIARSLFLDQLEWVTQPSDANAAAQWGALSKSAGWRILSAGIMLLALGGIAAWAARHRDEPLVMPAAAVLFALLSPLSWLYSYLTALVFLAVLPLRFGRVGLGFVGVWMMFFLPSSLGLTTGSAYGGPNMFQGGGTGLMALLCIGFIAAFGRADRSETF